MFHSNCVSVINAAKAIYNAIKYLPPEVYNSKYAVYIVVYCKSNEYKPFKMVPGAYENQSSAKRQAVL